jgi:hypothetical protein
MGIQRMNYQFAPSNVTGVDPYLPNPSVRGVPGCPGTASIPGCVANVIANFTPGNTPAASHGYHAASRAAVIDALFPQWLCKANLPEVLVSMGCVAAVIYPPKQPVRRPERNGGHTRHRLLQPWRPRRRTFMRLCGSLVLVPGASA